MSNFSGIPKAGLKFLADIKENNNKDWFDKNRDLFKNELQEPLLDFIEALGERLKTLSTGIDYSLKLNGGSLKRIHRDVRFSKDKSPYKDHMMLEIWEGPARKESHSSFYMRIDSKNFGIGVGHHMFEKPFLEKYREAILNDKTGKSLQKLIEKLTSDGYGLGGDALKTVPRGFEKDHPRAELLKYKGMYVHTPDLLSSKLTSANGVDLCFEHCERMFPYHKWLVGLGN